MAELRKIAEWFLGTVIHGMIYMAAWAFVLWFFYWTGALDIFVKILKIIIGAVCR